MGNANEIVGSLPLGLAFKMSDAVLGDDVIGDGARYGNNCPLGKHRRDTGYSPVAAAGRGCHHRDTSTPLAQKSADGE